MRPFFRKTNFFQPGFGRYLVDHVLCVVKSSRVLPTCPDFKPNRESFKELKGLDMYIICCSYCMSHTPFL